MAQEERDPHTGRLTTGHEWNGITELNTPIPRLVWFFLISALLCAAIMWALLPTWPTGNSYTKGWLGADEKQTVEANLIAAKKRREGWLQRIENTSFETLAQNPESAAYIATTGKRLFLDNCAMCHGETGKGTTNYPNLTDDQWIWGGAPEDIMETLRVGINHIHPETRYSLMQAYGRDGLLAREDIEQLVTYVQSLSHSKATYSEMTESNVAAGAVLFQEQCTSCHGENAKGMPSVGAPNLTDEFWIYGGDEASIYQTLQNGRQGVMPGWDQRLSLVDRKILTLYVLSLKDGADD